MAHDIFICHAAEDRQLANALATGLEAEGLSCWIAPRDVMAGADYAQSIVAGISGAKAMVLVFSQHSNESQHIGREVERAVSRGLEIIPYRIEEIIPSASLEYFISTSQWLDATAGDTERHLAELVRVVRIRVFGEAAEEPRRAAGEVLRQLIDQYGPGIADDPRRLRALLRDMAGVHPAEIAALVAAVEEGVGTALQQSSQGLAPEAEQRLARRLEDHRALTEDAAVWAVAAWSQALAKEEPVHPEATAPVTGELPGTVAAVGAVPADQPTPEPASPPERTASTEAGRPQSRVQAVAAGQAATVAASPGVASRARPIPQPTPQPSKRNWVVPVVVALVAVGAFAAGAVLMSGGDDGASTTTRPTGVATTPAVTTPASAAFFTFAGLTTDDIVDRYAAEAVALGLPDGCVGLEELTTVGITTDRLEPGESFVWGRFAAPFCDVEMWGITDQLGTLRELTVQVAEPTEATVTAMQGMAQAVVGAIGYPEAEPGFARSALDQFGWLESEDPTTHQGETLVGRIQLGTFLHEGGYTFYLVPAG